MKKYIASAVVLYTAFILGSCATMTASYGPMPGTVAKYISRNGPDIGDYPISSLATIASFNRHERDYDVYENLDTIWKDYTEADPTKAFDGRIIDFGLLFNPGDSAVHTQKDPVPFFTEGQIYILNLKVFGFYNFPVAFKVTRIDSVQKMFEFVYLQKNIVNGVQRVYFESSFDETGRPVTLIRHISFFKSGNGFQDKVLYPPLHKQTIDDFHSNVLKVNRLVWSAK